MLCHTIQDLKRDLVRQANLYQHQKSRACQRYCDVHCLLPALVPVLEKGSTQTTGKGEAVGGRILTNGYILSVIR